LLSDASGIWTNYPHLMLCPALVISLLMICFNLFSNGLRDAFNPALRGVEE
jgi:oligopeptide transport system permease protein